jgi:ribonuclease HI
VVPPKPSTSKNLKRKAMIPAKKKATPTDDQPATKTAKVETDPAKYSLRIYADGSCLGNGSSNAPGGWACVVRTENEEGWCQTVRKECGAMPSTTNNRMELTAIIKAFTDNEWTKNASKIVVVTDSNYAVQGFTSYIKSWVRNGWKTAQKQPVKNQDLWKELLKVTEKLKVEMVWTKGHKNNTTEDDDPDTWYNNMVDSLARSKAIELQASQKHGEKL